MLMQCVNSNVTKWQTSDRPHFLCAPTFTRLVVGLFLLFFGFSWIVCIYAIHTCMKMPFFLMKISQELYVTLLWLSFFNVGALIFMPQVMMNDITSNSQRVVGKKRLSSIYQDIVYLYTYNVDWGSNCTHIHYNVYNVEVHSLAFYLFFLRYERLEYILIHVYINQNTRKFYSFECEMFE